MDLQATLAQLREALGEPGLQVSEPWLPFVGGSREIRVLKRPPLGRGQFGIVFAVIIRVAPGSYMPAAMKMAALLDDHVTEVLNGLAVDELLDAGVTPGLCYMLDAFAHSTLKPGSVKTPPDWDNCVWTYIDEFVFSVREEVARHYGPHAIFEAHVLDPQQPKKKGRARVSGGYTFGFVFTELVLARPSSSLSPSTAQELLSELYVQFDAIRGLGAVGLLHCDISSRNCLVGRQLVPRRQGLHCLLRGEASQALRQDLYGLSLLRFGVDCDRPLAFAHVSNSFEQAREDPAYMASYTSIATDCTPVLIDYGKMRRAELPANQDLEQTRQEIARRLQVKEMKDVPKYVISAASPPAYDYMGAYRGRPEALGSALPAHCFPTYPTTTETSRAPEQINPFVVASSPVQPFLVVHSELAEVCSMAIVAVERILGYAPFGNCFLVSDDGKMRPGSAALPLEMSTTRRKSVLKLGGFHPECVPVPGMAVPEGSGGNARWATFVNKELRARIEEYIRRTLARPEFAQASCTWLGFARRTESNEPSEPELFAGVAFTMAQRVQALGVPGARDVEGTFFAGLFQELRAENYNEQSGWLRVILEHTLRTRFQLSPVATGDLVEDLMACLSWDAAKRPPARRLLRNTAFRLLDVPLLSLVEQQGRDVQRLWSAEVPTAAVWPSRPRADGSGKLSLLAASEVPRRYEHAAPDGALPLPSERCKMGCRPVAAALEIFRRHGRVPGFLLKDHKSQPLLHPSDTRNVAIFNFNTGMLDYYDGKPYINFALRRPASVTQVGLNAAFKHDTTLGHYLQTLLHNVDEALIPDWLFDWTLTEEEEEEEEVMDEGTISREPLAKRPRLDTYSPLQQ